MLSKITRITKEYLYCPNIAVVVYLTVSLPKTKFAKPRKLLNPELSNEI